MLSGLVAVFLSSQLTPHDISQAHVSELNRSQLRYEDWRLSDPPSFGGWITMLAIGAPVAGGGTLLSYLAIDETSRAQGWAQLVWWVIDFAAVAVTVVGYGLSIAGTVMMPITAWRRGKYQERRQLVQQRLHDFEAGRAEAPYEHPEDEAWARRDLLVTRLNARRPSLGLPLGLMGGGMGAGVYYKRRMATFFMEGGWSMYPITFLGVIALGLATVALLMRSKGVAVAALVVSGTVLMLGVGGMMMGRNATDQALSMVNPADAEQIREVGYRESLRPLQLAGGVDVLSSLLAVTAFVLASRKTVPPT